MRTTIFNYASVCLLFILSSNILSAQNGVKIYVAPNGNDKNSGTIEKPFRTLERAKMQVRQKGNNQPVTVYLRWGDYALDSTFILRPENSGEKEAPVVYRAYANEKPVVSGARQIKGWKKLGDHSSVINPAMQGKVWVASIPKGWLFHYFYVNGKMRRRSQSDHRYWREWNKDHTPGTPDIKGQIISFKNKGPLKYLPSNGDAEMLCIYLHYGAMGNGVITDVDTVKGTLRWNSSHINVGDSRDPHERGYRFENVPYFIDTPGDWAVDSKNGLVYYYPMPGENLSKDVATAPHLYELVRFEGNEATNNLVHDVELNGIEFSYTDRIPENTWPSWFMNGWENVDATIYMSGTQRCALKNNRIMYSGAYGVNMSNFAQQNIVEGNEIGYTGSGGLRLVGYGPGKIDVNRENVVERNYIHDHGLGNYWHSSNIQISQSGHNRIAYNLLQRSGYTGISIGGVSYKAFNDPDVCRRGFYLGQVERWWPCRIRFEDFPDSVQKGVLNRTYKFDRETVKPYLHSNENIIEYNIISEPHTLLYEGGAIYAWFCGKNNLWQNNLIFKSAGMPGSSVLALDDVAEYTTVKENVFWVEGKILNGVGARSNERGNQINNNYRVNYKPQFEATNLKEKVGTWWFNEPGREKMDVLLKQIQNAVQSKGGWLGNPAIGIPTAGEPIHKYGTSEVLPQGAHVTIEE